MIAKWCGVSFGGDKNVLKLIVVTVAYLCEYTKLNELYDILPISELYLNNVVIKKS